METPSVLQLKIESLYHVSRELIGVINEYRAMPCDSLRTRMFQTAERYARRVSDNAPESTMHLSMTLPKKADEPDWEAPVYVNSGRRLIVILRNAGAPEGQEAEALRSLLYLRDTMSLRLKLLKDGHQPAAVEAVVRDLAWVPMPAKGTEGQKVVDIAFSAGAAPGAARHWLKSLINEVEILSVKLKEVSNGIDA